MREIISYILRVNSFFFHLSQPRSWFFGTTFKGGWSIILSIFALNLSVALILREGRPCCLIAWFSIMLPLTFEDDVGIWELVIKLEMRIGDFCLFAMTSPLNTYIVKTSSMYFASLDICDRLVLMLVESMELFPFLPYTFPGVI